MKKKWALYLGNILGIKVFIHWTFVILLAWVFLMHTQMGHGFSEAIWGVVFILALFVCVIFHEFGHALTAKRYNIQTKDRSEEHTSELQSLMRISYAVFCLKKKKK